MSDAKQALGFHGWISTLNLQDVDHVLVTYSTMNVLLAFLVDMFTAIHLSKASATSSILEVPNSMMRRRYPP